MDKRVLLYFNSKSQPSKIELWSGDRIVGDSLIGENQRITYHYVNGNKWFGQINRNLNYMKQTFPDDYDKNDFILKSNVNYDGLESLESHSVALDSEDEVELSDIGSITKFRLTNGTEMIWKNGDKYVANFENNYRSEGAFYYHDGAVFVGRWVNDKQEGRGSYTFPEGDSEGRKRFEGIFDEGAWKAGTMEYRTGDKFVGDFEHSKKKNGTLYSNDGTTYVGPWVNDKPHGFGIFTFPCTGGASDDLKSYEGWIEEGKPTIGTSIFFSGLKYVNHYGDVSKDSVFNITAYYPNGTVVLVEHNETHSSTVLFFDEKSLLKSAKVVLGNEGQNIIASTFTLWNDGECDLDLEKTFACHFDDGSRFSGQTVNGTMRAHGTLPFPENDKKGRKSFTGDIEDGKATYGTLTWRNGDQYIGEFADNQRSGRGSFYYADGLRYVGRWLNDKRHGQGTLYNTCNEIIHDGEWRNDEFVI